nr:LysE family translocator [uncultured Tolumonas sp.]
MNNLYAFICFALVASITPGPTNFLILSQSSRLGVLKTLPVVLSASSGAAALVCLTGMGMGKALLAYSFLKEIMGWIGVVWLTILAWQIASQPVAENSHTPSDRPSISAVGAFLMQAVNPKAWLMAVAVICVYATSGAHYFWNIAALSAVFLLVAMPCLTLWAFAGQLAGTLIRHPHHVRWFNRGMAAILLLSAWSATLNLSL